MSNFIKFRTWILVLLCAMLFSCHSDKEEEISLSTDDLAQTVWEGTATFNSPNADKPWTVPVLIEFYSSKKGLLIIEYGRPSYESSEFNYSANGKAITLSTQSGIYSGYHIVTKHTQGELEMVCYNETPVTYQLHRKH